MSLRRITLNTAAMSSVTLLRMLVQTLIIPVLARILSPSDYGIVAMAMPFIFFAMMFADAGMGVSLVRTSDTEHSIWSTSFWLTVLIGLGLTLAVVIVGFIAASFFAEPRLGPVVAALAIVIFLQAIATIPGAALQQKHRFHTIASIEIAAMIISTAAALVTALQGNLHTMPPNYSSPSIILPSGRMPFSAYMKCANISYLAAIFWAQILSVSFRNPLTTGRLAKCLAPRRSAFIRWHFYSPACPRASSPGHCNW